MKPPTQSASDIHHTLRERVLLWALAAVGVGLWTLPLWWGEGMVVYGDIDFGLRSEVYGQRAFTLWNDLWSNPNFFNLSRAPLVALLLLVGWLLGLGAEGLYPLLVWGLGTVGVVGVIRLWQGHRQSEDSQTTLPWVTRWGVLAVVGGVYLHNPWVVHRLQHIYLLAGWALGPWVLHQCERALWADNREIWSPQTLGRLLRGALLWVLAGAAVHWWFYLGGVLAWAVAWRSVDRRPTDAPVPWAWVRLGALGGMVLGLSLHFLLPMLLASGGGAGPTNINTVDTIGLFSRMSDWRRVLTVSGYWWSDVPRADTGLWWGGSWAWLGVVIASGAATALWRRWLRPWVGLGVVLLGLSMGTQGPLRGLLLWLVFDGPLAGAIGFIFRDPDKLSGLVLIVYSLCLGSGLTTLVQVCERRHALWQKLRPLAQKLGTTLLLPRRHRAVQGVVGLLTVLSVLGGGAPHYAQYLLQGYAPVAVPAPYAHWAAGRPAATRVGYLPRFEAWQSPHTAVGTTPWNPSAPTAGLDIHSTTRHTYNPTEGTTPVWRRWYDWTEHQLEYNLTDQLGPLWRSLGVSELVLHRDIYGQGSQLIDMLGGLGRQLGVSAVTRHGDWWGADLTAVGETISEITQPRVLGRAVLSLGGWAGGQVLSALPGSDMTNTALWWADQQSTVPSPDTLQAGDLLVERFASDLPTLWVDRRHRYAPFDHTDQADAFTRWAKSSVNSPDWRWHQQHQGLTMSLGQGDSGRGIALTTSPMALDVPPHTPLDDLGKVVLQTEDVLGTNADFFVADDPEVIEVDFAPTNVYDALPYLRGEITEGGGEYWKVVTSQPIDIDPLMGYRFGLTVSGHGTDRLHGKVKYYDEAGEELTVSYVTAPHAAASFDVQRFVGSFITPAAARTMRLQLWTHQRPSQRVYWWVHDLEVRQLATHTVPNELPIPITADGQRPHRVLARVWHSGAGGQVDFGLGSWAATALTRSPDINQWYWEDLGTVTPPLGLSQMTITNVQGFNAVNEVLVVPEDDWQAAQAKATAVRSRTRGLTVLEPSLEMNHSGNIQTGRRSSALTNGQGVRLNDGVVTASVDVTEAGQYDLYVGVDMSEDARATDEHQVFRSGRRQRTVEQHTVLSPALQAADFPTPQWPTVHQAGAVPMVHAGTYDLLPGRAIWKHKLRDTSPSLLSTESLHPFAYDAEWYERHRYLDTLGDTERNADCCDCVDLGADHLKVRLNAEKEAIADTTAGCSCWWSITASDLAEVTAGDEYWLRFEARSQFARRPHFKLIFLDENRVFVDYHILQHTPEGDTWPWTEIERLVTVPSGTKYVQWQVWSRQNRFTESQTAVRGLTMKRYGDLPLLDSWVLVQRLADEATGGPLQDVLRSPAPHPAVTLTATPTPSGKQLHLTHPPETDRLLLALPEAYHPLWKTDQSASEIVPHWGLTQTVVVRPEMTDTETNFAVYFMRKNLWWWRWVLSAVTLSGLLMVLIYKKIQEDLRNAP